MCAKRSGVVKRLKARKAELLKLLNSGNAISWKNSVKIHAEAEHIKKLLTVRKNQTTATHTSTYSVIPLTSFCRILDELISDLRARSNVVI